VSAIHRPKTRIELLLAQFDIAVGFFANVVEPFVDDAVCLWQPDERSWTVHPPQEGAGSWTADWIVPEPDDVSATVGWDLWHLGMFLTVAHDGAFGTASVRREDVSWPGSAEAGLVWIKSSFRRWRDAVESLSETDLDVVGRADMSGFYGRGNPFAQRSLGWVLAWANFEVISLVRALGRAPGLRSRLGPR